MPQGFTQVYTIDSVLGGTPRQITSGKYNHNGPEWAADGKTIYVSSIRKPDAEYLRGDSEIYAIDLKTLEVKALTRPRRSRRKPASLARWPLDRLYRL